MIIKNIKNDTLDMDYGHYKYPYNKNYIVKLEIERYKYFNRLNRYFRDIFQNSKHNISWILVKNVSLNLCNLDPLLSLVNKKDLINVYGNSIENDALDKNIKFLNHKIMKYILKLYTYVLSLRDNDYNIITEHKSDNVILFVQDFEDDTYITINKDIFLKMQDRYHNIYKNDTSNMCTNLIWSVLFRYNYLDMLYYGQGKMHDDIYYEISNKFNIHVELFGSAFNSTLKYFGSLFYDIEKYFGSIGNFFNCNLKKGFFIYLRHMMLY